MAKGNPLYAKLECEFMRSFRFQQLPAGARILYLSLWCYALEQRRQTIPRPTDYYLASLAGLHRHPVATYLARLHDLGLCYATGTYIEMIGIAEKHKPFQFKDAPSIPQQAPKHPPLRIEVEEKEKKEKKEKIPPIPPQGESSDGDPPVSTKPQVKHRGRVKPAIETMPEEEYIAQVNTAFASLRTLVEDQWVDSENLKRWLVTYDRINVDGQIRMAKQWLLDNAGDPKKRRKNFNAFTANWLGRVQTRAEQEGTCYKPEKDEDDGYSISPERLAEIDAIEAEIARSGGRKTLSERQAEIKALKAGVAKEEEAGHPKPNGD